MRRLKKLLHLFFILPGREKFFTVILSAVFIVALSQYFIQKGTISLSSDSGFFTEGMIGRIRAINPLFVEFNDVDRDVARLVYSGLIRYDPEERNFYTDLAESFSKNSSGTEYTFILRENVLWHDGTPFTAEDVLFTLRDIVQNPAFRNPILHEAFGDVSIEKKDNRTIKFTLNKPNSYFISQLTVGILPKHLLKDTLASTLEKASFNKEPIGSGPYRVIRSKVDTDNTFVDLEVFPDYYGKKPSIPRLRIFTALNEKTLMSQKSALNAVGKFSVTSPFIAELGKDGFNSYSYTLNQFSALYFNTNQPLLQKTTIRKALSAAIDKDKLVGQGEKRIDTIDLKEKRDDVSFKQDTEKTKKILVEAGFTLNNEGNLIDNKGNRFSLKLLTLEKTPNELIEEFTRQWKGVGIEIITEKVPADLFATLVQERRYDILLIKQSLGYNRDVYPIFNSSQALKQEGETSSAGLNFSNFRSFRTDGITEAMRKETLPVDKEKLLQELSSVLIEEQPVIFISTPIYSYLIKGLDKSFPTDSLDFHSDRLAILPYL